MALPNRPAAGTPEGRAPAWSATESPPSRLVPVANAERDLAEGNYDHAVREAYHRVVLDLQKAYGLSLPAQWTHRQFLTEFLRDDMGILTTLVDRLYRLYEPVRYGTRPDWLSEDPVQILTLIYTEPSMRDLYRPGSSAPPTPIGPRRSGASLPTSTDAPPDRPE
jgi:hypothetical protein